MASVFRQQYTKPVPPVRARVEIEVSRRGKKVKVPGISFKGEDGKTTTAPLTAKGTHYRARSPMWYGNVKQPDGTVERVALSANKTVAEEMLRTRQAEADRARNLGVPVERLQGKARPLEEWLADYEAAVRSGSRRRSRRRLARPSEDHVAKVLSRLRALVKGCGFAYPGDVELGKVQGWLDGRQRAGQAPELPSEEGRKRPGYAPGELAKVLGVSLQAVGGLAARHGLTLTGKGKARRMARGDALRLLAISRRGDSERTASYYAREARTFSRWLVEQGALGSDPLRDLPGATRAASHRHDRRALEEEEVLALLEATRSSKRTFRGLSGVDRWALYLCALSTGFRAGELASLTPSAFRLDGQPPFVLLGKQASKNGEGATQPLPSQVVEPLRQYLEVRPLHSSVWADSWVADAADMLRADLQEANIPHVQPGPDGDEFVDFHGLRHSFIARLDRAGVDLKTASALARHSTVELTAKVYARPKLKALAGAVDRLGGPASQDAGR